MSSQRLSWVPWYPSDFIGSTLGWPLIARGVYRELLDANWLQGGLPDDLHQLAAIARCTESEFAQAWPYLEDKFPLNGDGKRKNPRMEEHRLAAVALVTKKKAAGKKGAEARWSSPPAAKKRTPTPTLPPITDDDIPY